MAWIVNIPFFSMHLDSMRYIKSFCFKKQCFLQLPAFLFFVGQHTHTLLPKILRKRDIYSFADARRRGLVRVCFHFVIYSKNVRELSSLTFCQNYKEEATPVITVWHPRKHVLYLPFRLLYFKRGSVDDFMATNLKSQKYLKYFEEKFKNHGNFSRGVFRTQANIYDTSFLWK